MGIGPLVMHPSKPMWKPVMTAWTMIVMASQMKAVPNVLLEQKSLAKVSVESGRKSAMNHRFGFPAMHQRIAHAQREKPNLKNAETADIRNHPVLSMAPGSRPGFARGREPASRGMKKRYLAGFAENKHVYASKIARGESTRSASLLENVNPAQVNPHLAAHAAPRRRSAQTSVPGTPSPNALRELAARKEKSKPFLVDCVELRSACATTPVNGASLAHVKMKGFVSRVR